jgi:hypothetical protein
MIGLLVVGALAHLSERGHQLAAIGTLLLVWGLVEVWLRSNTVALLHVSKLILVPQRRPKAEDQTSDEECQPGLIGWRQPREEDEPLESEEALVLEKRTR